MPVATLAAIGTTVSVLNGAFVLGKQFFEIHTAPDEIRSAIEQLALVQSELEHGRRLRDQKFPDKTSPDFGSNTQLGQMQRAINTLANGIRRCERMLVAVDDKGTPQKVRRGSVTVVDRFKWVMGNKGGFRDLYATLTIPHTILSRSIAYLEGLRDGDEAPPPYRDNIPFDESFLSHMQRRKARGKSVDLHRGEEKGAVTPSRIANLDCNTNDDGAMHRASSLPPNGMSSKAPRRARNETQVAVDPPTQNTQQASESTEEFDQIYMRRVKRQRRGY